MSNTKKAQNVQGYELYNNETEKIIDKKNLMTPSEARGLDPLSNIKIYHITTALHNSRISERMIKYKVNKSNDIQLLTSKEELLITKVIAKIRLDDNLKILAYNICQDHIHLLIISEENNIENTVKKIKSLTARKLNQYRENLAKNNNMAYENFNNSNNSKIYQNLTDATRGQDPLSGFDVVVGNPPYGVNFDDKTKKYLSKFDNLVPDYEIYIYFISLYKKILKRKGYLSYIFPNTFLSTLFGKKYRENLLEEVSVKEIVDLSNDNTFANANVRTIIFNFKNLIEDKKSIFTKMENKNFKLFETYSKEEILQNVENISSLFFQNRNEKEIVKKIKGNKQVKDFFEISQGLIPYDKYRGHDEYTIKN